jgi:hypothetical protein
MNEVKVKSLPLLMNTEMVRATLEDRKTNTRWLRGLEDVNQEPSKWRFDGFACEDDFGRVEGDLLAMFHSVNREIALQIKCPYGNVGDQLWVRETWQLGTGDGNRMGINVQVKTEPWCIEVPVEHREAAVVMAKKIGYGGKWRPSIHMPKWASRITLELTDVRVERLQAISESDAEAEGVQRRFEIDVGTFIHGSMAAIEKASTYRIGFKHLWDQINGAGSWASNPFCWALSFRRIRP